MIPLGEQEAVWFMGPWQESGYYLRVSTETGRSGRPPSGEYHRPPDFPWKSMDREWGACYKPQGTTAMDYAEGWSVLSVADRTVDSRPNVLVALAVQRPDVPETEMRVLAAERYPSVWKRLGVVEMEVEAMQKAYNALCSAEHHLEKADAGHVVRGRLAEVRHELGRMAFPTAGGRSDGSD